MIYKDSASYQEKIKKEAEFWDSKIVLSHYYNKSKKAEKPVYMWDDEEVNNLLRGKYLFEIINTGKTTAGNVLDLGCGNGVLCYEISKGNKDREIWGIDISKKRIELAREFYDSRKDKQNLSKIIYKIDDLSLCDLPEDYFEFVYVWDTLHHIPEIEHLISETYKSLKQNMSFFVFDHIGKSKIGWLIYIVLWLILPTYDSYGEKIRKIVNKFFRKESIDKNILRSPFEDVSCERIVGVIKKYFKVQSITYLLAFNHYLIPKLRIKKTGGLIKFLVFAENLLIKFNFLKPEYVYIKAIKQ